MGSLQGRDVNVNNHHDSTAYASISRRLERASHLHN